MLLDLSNWLLVFLRVGAFLAVLPFFSFVNFPPTMRVAMAALIGLLLGPMLPPYPLWELPLLSLVGVMAQEISIGLLLGFVSRMVFYAADLAGNVVATEMGLNLAAFFNPMTRQSEQAPGMVLFLLATVVMLTLDLHHWVLVGFQRTYLVLPVGGAHLSSALFEAVVRTTRDIFIVAVQIAAPVLAVSFVVMLVFALLSRAVPQMNVFVESFSFRVVGGLLVFGGTLHLTAQHVLNYLHRLPDDLLGLAQILSAR